MSRTGFTHWFGGGGGGGGIIAGGGGGGGFREEGPGPLLLSGQHWMELSPGQKLPGLYGPPAQGLFVF